MGHVQEGLLEFLVLSLCNCNAFLKREYPFGQRDALRSTGAANKNLKSFMTYANREGCNLLTALPYVSYRCRALNNGCRA